MNFLMEHITCGEGCACTSGCVHGDGHARALMSEVFAMQCSGIEAETLAVAPTARRNDAYTTIYFYRYF